MLFVWLLAKPVFDLLKTFIQPIAVIGLVILVDLGLGIGITQFVVNTSIEILKDALIPDSIQETGLLQTFMFMAIYG
jgi:uncharacterized membrane protein YvlD (DUF360 family)